jgi:hypothetical protein
VANRVEQRLLVGAWYCNRRSLHSWFSEHKPRRHSCSSFPCFMPEGCAYLGLQVKAINCISPCLCVVLIGFNPLPTRRHCSISATPAAFLLLGNFEIWSLDLFAHASFEQYPPDLWLLSRKDTGKSHNIFYM